MRRTACVSSTPTLLVGASAVAGLGSWRERLRCAIILEDQGFLLLAASCGATSGCDLQAMDDRIEVGKLRLECILGVNDSERSNKQPIVVSVIMWTDLTPTVEREDAVADTRESARSREWVLGDTYNYSAVTKSVCAETPEGG